MNKTEFIEAAQEFKDAILNELNFITVHGLEAQLISFQRAINVFTHEVEEAEEKVNKPKLTQNKQISVSELKLSLSELDRRLSYAKGPDIRWRIRQMENLVREIEMASEPDSSQAQIEEAKIVQIMQRGEILYALKDDGSLWIGEHHIIKATGTITLKWTRIFSIFSE